MNNIGVPMPLDISNIPRVEHARLAIYTFNRTQLEAIIAGKAKVDNLPEGAKIYKILLHEPAQCDNMLNVWYSHESFDEIPEGAYVPTVWTYVSEIK